ncbi:WxcM-like domain-containing protein [Candidatus Altiarchaeota archaeon]
MRTSNKKDLGRASGAKLVSSDERRKLYNIINSRTWSDVNYVEAAGGKTLGGHYHKSTRELIFITKGVVEVEMQNVSTREKKEFYARKRDYFIIEPGWRHTIRTKTRVSFVQMLSEKYDPKKPDIHD